MSEQSAAEQTVMPKHGQFCWNELATSNIEESKKFYSELFGWNWQEHLMEGMKYYEFSLADGKTFGGMWEIGDASCKDGESNVPTTPRWMSYVAVDDVDASAAKVAELGGSVCVPPMDIPNTGRFCVVNDPSGATVSLITLKR